MRTRYPLEFRQQIVELVHAGRNPEELAREFKPSEQTIRNWVKQAELDSGRRTDGLTTEERGGDPDERALRQTQAKVGELTMELELAFDQLRHPPLPLLFANSLLGV